MRVLLYIQSNHLSFLSVGFADVSRLTQLDILIWFWFLEWIFT